MSGVAFGDIGEPATPFQRNLLEVVDAETLPTYDTLNGLLQYLSNQVNKARSIEKNLLSACFQHYSVALTETPDESVQSRVILIQIIAKLLTVSAGQLKILSSDNIGISAILSLLDDPAKECRLAACLVLDRLAFLPDLNKELLDEKNGVMDKLYSVFLQDTDTEVQAATLTALSALSEFDPEISRESMAQCVDLLKSTYPVSDSKVGLTDVKKIKLVRSLLTTLVNVCCDANMKEMAVQLKVLDATATLISVPDEGICKNASSVICAVTVAQSGKLAAIQVPGLLDELCKIALDRESQFQTRQNAKQAIRNISANGKGLSLCGKTLLADASVLLEILTLREAGIVVDQNLGDAESSANVIDLLHVMCETAKGQRACFNIVEIIPRLDDLIHTQPNYIDVLGNMIAQISSFA